MIMVSEPPTAASSIQVCKWRGGYSQDFTETTAINYLQIWLVGAAFHERVAAKRWPHSLFLPCRCRAPSAYSVQGRAIWPRFSQGERPFLASSLAFTSLEVVAMASPPRRIGIVSTWQDVIGFRSPVGLTLTNSQQTARRVHFGLRCTQGTAVCTHSGRMALRPWFSMACRPPFPSSLLQRHAWRSNNGPSPATYGGPVEAHHLLLDVGASCSRLLTISAWVVDRLLSQSLNMRIPFHAAGSSWGLLPCRLLVWPLLILVLPFYRFSVNSKPVLFFNIFPLYRCAWQG